MPLRHIHLYGEMADRFGSSFELDVASLAEAVRALGSQIQGFRSYLVQNAFHIVCGRSRDEGIELGEEQIAFRMSGDIHIMPVIEGAGGGRGGAAGKIIAGVALAAVAWFALPAMGLGAGIAVGGTSIFTASQVGMMGVSLALGGMSQLLARTEKPDTPTPNQDRKPSAAFNGPVNVMEQGGPVPLVIGQCRVGMTFISVGVTTAKIVLV